MKNFISNIGYFFKEARRICRTNKLSNVFTFLGTTLVLLLLALAVAGWSVSSRLVFMLEREAEVSAFFHNSISQSEAQALAGQIATFDGVLDASVIDEAEAYNRMEDILADEAGVLELFDENPFEAYIEIRIKPQKVSQIVEKLNNLPQIESVRDNKDILDQLSSLTNALSAIGYLVVIAVGITTIIIISHMIRQGIYNNREQINTLRLLGAPGSFIGLPFVLVGMLITISAGMLALGIALLLILYRYGRIGSTLSFIPLPVKSELMLIVTTVLVSVSVLLGILGSVFGLSSITKKSSPSS
jgi:cell division transport system permease protein